MKHCAKKVLAALALATAVVACAKPPKPPPPPPPPVVEAPPPAPPPCERLEEACTADAKTKAKVSSSELTFTPPAGWKYAQEPDGTIATADRSALVLVVKDVGPASAKGAEKERAKVRDQAAEVALKRLGVTFKKRKKPVWPRKPDKTMKIGDLSVALFQMEGALRETTSGPLLAFTADVPGSKLLVGFAFVPADDTSGADEAVLRSLESLGATPPEAQKP